MRHLLISAVVCLWTHAAIAHSPLASTSPADGSVVSSSVDTVTLVFKRNIRLTRVELGAKNGAVETLDLAEQVNFAKEFSIAIETLSVGDYIVEWRGLGDDGHAQKG